MARTFQECILTQEEAQAALIKWKKALSLEDWVIDLLHMETDSDYNKGRSEEGSSLTTRGWLQPNFDTKTAFLAVINPTEKEQKSYSIEPWDMEKVIVHELLHIHFSHASQFYGGTPDNLLTTTEQSIELISSALIAAKRGLI